MEDVLAGKSCICELALDAVIKNSDASVVNLIESHVEARICRAYELPRLRTPHLTSETVDVERFCLDAECILLACNNDSVILVCCESATCCRVNKSVRTVIYKIEVSGCETFE